MTNNKSNLTWKGVVLGISFFFTLLFLVCFLLGSRVQSEIDCEILIEYETLPENTSCFIPDVDPRFCPLPKMVHCKGSMDVPLILINNLG